MRRPASGGREEYQAGAGQVCGRRTICAGAEGYAGINRVLSLRAASLPLPPVVFSITR